MRCLMYGQMVFECHGQRLPCGVRVPRVTVENKASALTSSPQLRLVCTTGQIFACHHKQRQNDKLNKQSKVRNRRKSRLLGTDAFKDTSTSPSETSVKDDSFVDIREDAFEKIVVKDNRSRGRENLPSSVQGKIVHHLISGEFDEAFLESHAVNTLNWCIRTLGKYSRVDLSEQLFHWMRLKGIANEHSLIKLLEGYEANHESPARAVRTWRNVLRMQSPFRPGYMSTAALMKTFRHTLDLKGALRLFREIKIRRLPVNHYAYNVLIRLAAEAREMEDALALEMDLRTSPGVQPDLRTYSALMLAVARTQKWSQTKVVHSILKEQGIIPDATLALQLLSGYAKCGWPAAAEAVLDAYKDDHNKPNRTHWNALLDSYAIARQYNGCLMAYKRMTEKIGIKPDSYTMVALLKAGKSSQVGRSAVHFVLGEIQSYNIQLTIELCSSAISCCRTIPFISLEEARASEELATRIWRLMLDASITPNQMTYNTMMAVHADAANIEGVERLFALMESDLLVDPDEATWKILLRAFGSANMWEDVERISALRETWRTLNPQD